MSPQTLFKSLSRRGSNLHANRSIQSARLSSARAELQLTIDSHAPFEPLPCWFWGLGLHVLEFGSRGEVYRKPEWLLELRTEAPVHLGVRPEHAAARQATLLCYLFV